MTKKPLRRLEVRMNDVLAAMSSAPDDPMIAYLDVEKGEVVHHLSLQAALEYGEVLEEDDAIRAAIEAEPERFVAIERLGSKRHYQLMARWASTVGEEDLRARLDIALVGKGAFRRFREVVSAYPDLEASWRASEQEALLDIALRWLRDDLGIEPVYTLRAIEQAPASHGAQPTTKPPTVGLLDVLLLGAPDGKTELIDGRVRRWLPAKSPGDARRAFKALAREVCDLHGIGWRNRFLEGDPRTFERERFHLTLHERGVEVSVDVPRALWDAFV